MKLLSTLALQQGKSTITLSLLAVMTWLLAAGCAFHDSNPGTPRTHTGYVDFYTTTNMNLSWEVKCANEQSGEMETIYSEFKPLSGTVLRLAVVPGKRQFQVWFLNRVTERPETADVKVVNACVTPVHVTLDVSGTTSVDEKTYGFRGSSRGFARGTKFTSAENAIFQIGIAPGEPQAYKPMEQMPYFSAKGK